VWSLGTRGAPGELLHAIGEAFALPLMLCKLIL
jgi:hypothetical protein